MNQGLQDLHMKFREVCGATALPVPHTCMSPARAQPVGVGKGGPTEQWDQLCHYFPHCGHPSASDPHTPRPHGGNRKLWTHSDGFPHLTELFL